MDELRRAEEAVVEALKRRGSILVALSGGVDSSVVAALAFKALKDRAAAVTISSPLHPPWEVEEARRVAERIGLRHAVLRLNELEDPSVAGNRPDRCYHCKRLRFTAALKLAEELELSCVADGTNADDLSDRRPGLKALRELNVFSPLAEAGLGKREVRGLAARLGLPSTHRPSSACLATRFPYGRPLTLEALRRVAEGERVVAETLGAWGCVRVRDHGDLARIEVERGLVEALVKPEVALKVASRLKGLGYRFVAVDLEGYRRGSWDLELDLHGA
jgi:uncharacterized protein